ATRSAEQIWSQHFSNADANHESQPAYQELKKDGMDACGLAQLASRTVGVPFVGVIAAAMVIAELLRRLQGGEPIEFAGGSVATLEDFETTYMPGRPYPGSFVRALATRSGCSNS